MRITVVTGFMSFVEGEVGPWLDCATAVAVRPEKCLAVWSLPATKPGLVRSGNIWAAAAAATAAVCVSAEGWQSPVLVVSRVLYTVVCTGHGVCVYTGTGIYVSYILSVLKCLRDIQLFSTNRAGNKYLCHQWILFIFLLFHSNISELSGGH